MYMCRMFACYKIHNPYKLLFSCSVMSYSLQLHGLQHARLLCPSSSPRVCSNSCPLSRWFHPTILSSVVRFSFCFQSFPASGSFLKNQLFTSGGQSIWASASVLWHSAFFMVQVSHLYMTTEKTITLYGPLLAKWCLCCFLICSLGLS